MLFKNTEEILIAFKFEFLNSSSMFFHWFRKAHDVSFFLVQILRINDKSCTFYGM